MSAKKELELIERRITLKQLLIALVKEEICELQRTLRELRGETGQTLTEE